MQRIALFLILSVFLVKVHSHFRFTKIVCNSTNAITIYEKCLVERVNKTVTTITIQQKLLQPLNSVMLNVSIVQFSNGLNRVLYSFKNVDCCSFLQKRRRNPVLRLLFARLQKYSNINHGCPFKDNIWVRNLVISYKELLRLPIPRGEYTLMSSWNLNGINTVEVNGFATYN